MASQQLSMYGNVLFRNVAQPLLWWLVGRTIVAKRHGAKKYRSMFSTAHKGQVTRADISLPPVRLA